MQQILLIFWKNPTCTPLFHPARLLTLGNFEPKAYFALVKNEKFQPAWPYRISCKVSRAIFYNFSLLGATTFKGRLCIKGDYVFDKI